MACPDGNSRPTIYTQCQPANHRAWLFYTFRLGFTTLSAAKRPSIEGAVWMDNENPDARPVMSLKSNSLLSIKECSPTHLRDGSIESLCSYLRSRYPWVVGRNKNTRSNDRWDGTVAWEEYGELLQSGLRGYTPLSEYVPPEDPYKQDENGKTVDAIMDRPMEVSTEWTHSVLSTLFPVSKGTSFTMRLPSSPDLEDDFEDTESSWRCLYALFRGEGSTEISFVQRRRVKLLLGVMWILLADLSDDHPCWEYLHLMVVTELLSTVNEDIHEYNELVDEWNSQVPPPEELSEKIPLVFPDREGKVVDVDAFSKDECRYIMHQRAFRSFANAKVEVMPQPTPFELGFLAQTAQARLFILTATSSPQNCDFNSEQIAWSVKLQEYKLPNSMRGGPAFRKVYMLASFAEAKYCILGPPPDPPENLKDDNLSFAERFEVVTVAGNSPPKEPPPGVAATGTDGEEKEAKPPGNPDHKGKDKEQESPRARGEEGSPQKSKRG